MPFNICLIFSARLISAQVQLFIEDPCSYSSPNLTHSLFPLLLCSILGSHQSLISIIISDCFSSSRWLSHRDRCMLMISAHNLCKLTHKHAHTPGAECCTWVAVEEKAQTWGCSQVNAVRDHFFSRPDRRSFSREACSAKLRSLASLFSQRTCPLHIVSACSCAWRFLRNCRCVHACLHIPNYCCHMHSEWLQASHAVSHQQLETTRLIMSCWQSLV